MYYEYIGQLPAFEDSKIQNLKEISYLCWTASEMGSQVPGISTLAFQLGRFGRKVWGGLAHIIGSTTTVCRKPVLDYNLSQRNANRVLPAYSLMALFL